MWQSVESFYRGEPLGEERKYMAVGCYRQIFTLLNNSADDCVFVPIRSLQYMAVIDKEEVIFAGIHRKNIIEFSWQDFDLSQISDLTSGQVGYKFIYYDLQALATMQRIPREFSQAMTLLTGRRKVMGQKSRVLKLKR